MPITGTKLLVRRVVFALLVCCWVPAVAASLVHISVERRGVTEYGAGYTIGRGTECFVITPLHVIEFASEDELTITDSEGRQAQARLIKQSADFDAALLQVAGPPVLDCPEEWEDGSGSDGAIQEAPFLIARKLDDTGRVTQSRLFPVATSREFIELEPFSANAELREGDSGSSLYAGSALVGMVTAVDTRSGQITAVTQSQIHGLFGSDVLPQGQKRIAVGGINYRNRENRYATFAAEEFVRNHGAFEYVSTNEETDVGELRLDYLIDGEVISVNSRRSANPDYEPPVDDSGPFGRRLLQELQDKLEEEIDEELGRDDDSQYRYLYTIVMDFDIVIDQVVDGTQIRSLERINLVVPDTGLSSTDTQNAAIGDGMTQALDAVFAEHGL